MTFFSEIDWKTHGGGRIASIMPDGLAHEIGLLPGDDLLAINGNKVNDVIDVQYYAAEESLELYIRRGKESIIYDVDRDYNQPLGIEFTHPTFDTDIRRCNNLCDFCFVLQMAPRFRRTLYIKDDDYRYSFLNGHFVTLTNLDDDDWSKIITMHLSPLYVSVHVTNLELRRRFLRNEAAPDIMEQLRELAVRGIEFHTQLVIVPDFNDGKWFDKSIEDLASLWPSVRSISVVPVGLTEHHRYKMRTHTLAEAETILNKVHKLQDDFLKRYSDRFVYATDEWYLVTGRPIPDLNYYGDHQLQENGQGMVRDFLEEWQGLKGEIAQWQSKSIAHEFKATFPTDITLITGTLFADSLAKIASEFSELTNIQARVIPINNMRLGESITVAGLLMVDDVINQLMSDELSNHIFLPRLMFDHPRTISLDDHSPQYVADTLGCRVTIGDSMGDVWDGLLGDGILTYYQEGSGI